MKQLGQIWSVPFFSYENLGTIGAIYLNSRECLTSKFTAFLSSHLGLSTPVSVTLSGIRTVTKPALNLLGDVTDSRSGEKILPWSYYSF